MAVSNLLLEHRGDEVPLPLLSQRARLAWQTVWKDVVRGALPARKRGGRWVVSHEDAERYIASHLGREPAA